MASKASTSKATTPTTTYAPATTTPSVVSPVPVVPTNGYATGLVRYVRPLKATGHRISAYNTTGATTGLTPAYLRTLAGAMPAHCKAQRYVVHCHTCNVWLGFATWAPAYAASMAHGSTALAPSVAASLGKAGLQALGLPGLTVRAPGATPTAPIAVPPPLALGAGTPA